MATAAIGFALQGLSMIVSGIGSSNAAKQDAYKAETAARVSRIQADQLDVNYREELSSTIANIRAIRASAGAATDSPTARALEREESRVSDRERNIEVGSRRMQAAQSSNDAAFFRRSAGFALFGGVARSLPYFAQAYGAR